MKMKSVLYAQITVCRFLLASINRLKFQLFYPEKMPTYPRLWNIQTAQYSDLGVTVKMLCNAVLVVFIEVRKSLTREHTSNHHPHTNGNNPISTNINSETCNEKSQSITVRTMVAYHQCITMFVIHVKGCLLMAVSIWGAEWCDQVKIKPTWSEAEY